MHVSSSTALTSDRPDTIVVIDRELQSVCEFLKPRQESECRTLAILLDRRCGDRRQTSQPVRLDRRRGCRRAPLSEATRALIAVLGFAVLHRDGARYVP